jgi:hypothetical protein
MIGRMVSPEESAAIDKMRAERAEKELEIREVRKVPTQFGEQTQDRVSPAEEASDRFDVHGSFSAKAIWHMSRAKTLMNGTTSVVYPFVRAHLAAALELLR